MKEYFSDYKGMDKNISKSISLRMEQQIRICLKPKPRFISEKMWLKIASRFIYIERTQPTMKVEEL